MTSGLDAAALLLDYVKQTHQSAVSHIRTLATYSTESYMVLDAAARRNLELTHSLADGARSKSLVSILDRTVTSMGGRLLRKWFDQPLLSPGQDPQPAGRRRPKCAADALLRGDLRDALRRIADLERLMARICCGAANARDLVSLKQSLQALPDVDAALARAPEGGALAPMRAVVADAPHGLDRTAGSGHHADEPPMLLREGGLIRDGYHDELDACANCAPAARRLSPQIEETERERTGIKNLKVGFNNVFGYYIEISKASGHVAVPDRLPPQADHGQCRALHHAGPERVRGAGAGGGRKDRRAGIPAFLFRCATRSRTNTRRPVLKLAKAWPVWTFSPAWPKSRCSGRFVRPEVHDGDTLSITAGRHPVVESLQSGTLFVPNDTYLDGDETRLHIITGPNSAGKSTYLRQVALIVLLAQIGSFVPADAASSGLVDRIFTRVGAHDDLASGQSTFMVEMNETANILNNATPRSLVILDEVGRGTSHLRRPGPRLGRRRVSARRRRQRRFSPPTTTI